MSQLPTQADIDLCIALNIPDCNAPIIAAHRIASTTEAADRITELAEAAHGYMSQFGQALDCNGIQYGPPQIEADERLRAALAKAGATQ